MVRDWRGRKVLQSLRQASTAARASSMLANGPRTLSSSSCRVWCSRSIFPVAAGERGLVSRWVMPFSRQIRPDITSAGRGFPNRQHAGFPCCSCWWSPDDCWRTRSRSCNKSECEEPVAQ